MPKSPKVSIRQNQYGNWYGYIGSKRDKHFCSRSEFDANLWLKNTQFKIKVGIDPNYIVSLMISQLVDVDLCEGQLEELKQFQSLVEQSSETASKNHWYDRLNEWDKPLYNFVSDKLNSNGFIQGQPDMNKNNKRVRVWWELYQYLSSLIYSPNLKSEVANHHSSAFERNEVLRKDMEYIVKYYEFGNTEGN